MLMNTNRTQMTLIFMISNDWNCEYPFNLCHLRSIIDLNPAV